MMVNEDVKVHEVRWAQPLRSCVPPFEAGLLSMPDSMNGFPDICEMFLPPLSANTRYGQERSFWRTLSTPLFEHPLFEYRYLYTHLEVGLRRTPFSEDGIIDISSMI
jgi:hypothetical protein